MFVYMHAAMQALAGGGLDNQLMYTAWVMATTAYNLSQTKHMACLWNEMGEVWNEEMETGKRGHGKKKFIHYIIV